MKWNQDDIDKAIDLNQAGVRFEEIGLILNRDVRSVQVRLNKLGYYQNKSKTTETLICTECGNEFIGKIKDKRKFCSQSCGAKHNNKKYPKRANINKLKNCLHCGVKLNSNQIKFCSRECSSTHYQQENFKKIENGDISFSATLYKRYLIYKHGEKCMKCGWHEVNPTTGLVPIQLEHKDGKSENHNLNNLELLCPNCHSLTPTYGALNKGNGRKKRRLKRKLKK
jgi:hypothetical protein